MVQATGSENAIAQQTIVHMRWTRSGLRKKIAISEPHQTHLCHEPKPAGPPAVFIGDTTLAHPRQ